VRRALELILERSTLNVRILTRSPLAAQDFDLFKKFGNRLLFGMSLPTLKDSLLKVYEPNAPGPQARLRTLQKAAAERIPLYVAVAPTYPECDEEDLRRTLQAIRPLKPMTVFHEPINIRAENVKRIATHAAGLQPPVILKTEVFDNGPSWRRYAVDQLMTLQRVASELGMEDCLHLWPDKSLKSKGPFLKARQDAFHRARADRHETAFEHEQRRAADEAAYHRFVQWLAQWHERISEWPGKKI
jgi:DNA repair photolyase